MAGGPFWIGFNEDGVAIAIIKYIDKLEEIARRLPFGPQALARAAPKSNLSLAKSQIQTLLVHIAEHQYRAVVSVLNHGRRQTVSIPFDVPDEFASIDDFNLGHGYSTP